MRLHGFDPQDAIIEVQPRDGDSHVIEDEDIVRTIAQRGAETAMVMFAGVQYLTGQVFDMKAIAEAGAAAGCVVGFDLAHGVGNVPLQLHAWGVDFAVWCTYKYLNAGPGAVAGLFVHAKHHDAIARRAYPMLAGWWGVRAEERFAMGHEFHGSRGARAFEQSCPGVLGYSGLRASLALLQGTELGALHRASWELCGQFRRVAGQLGLGGLRIVTPGALERSGAQLSLALKDRAEALAVFSRLHALGVRSDRREPNIIRVAFTALYNDPEDVFLTALALKRSMTGE